MYICIRITFSSNTIYLHYLNVIMNTYFSSLTDIKCLFNALKLHTVLHRKNKTSAKKAKSLK